MALDSHRTPDRRSRSLRSLVRGGAGGIALALAIPLSPTPADAAQLTREPYLQRISPESAILRWRTSTPTDSRVELGAVPEALDIVILDSSSTSEHRVELHGLAPESRYCYAVGSSTERLAGGDAGHCFRTFPIAGASRPLRVWAIGDSGTATSTQLDVRDAYLAVAADRPADVWLMLGDNAYDSGTDAQYSVGLFTPYAEVLASTALWPALGNHDAVSSDSPTLTGPYYASFSLPRQAESGGLASGTEAWYSFDFGPAHFVVLDSADSSLAPSEAMLTWLENDLTANSLPWVVVAFHHPPYTKGSHDSDNPASSGGRMKAMRENALPILEAHDVDLVLSGHSHSYERSFLLAGHYGTSSTLDAETMILDGGDGDPAGDGAYQKGPGALGGTVYVVAGSAATLAGGSLDHPAMAKSLAEYGSLLLDFDGDQVVGSFLAADGEILDRFVLVDATIPLFADDFESATLLGWPESVAD